MLSFATEVSQLVHSLGEMDNLAVKIAAAESAQAQHTVAKGSVALYDVIVKKAQDLSKKELPGHFKVAWCINQMAAALGKPPLTADTNLKIASVVAVDETLTSMLSAYPNDLKYAEARAYGREYLMEILRGVI